MSVDVDSRPLDCWMRPRRFRRRLPSGSKKVILSAYIETCIVPKDDSPE